GIAVELHQAALEIVLEALHLLVAGAARVLDGHDAARDAATVHHRPEDALQGVVEGLRVLLVAGLVGLEVAEQLVGGALDHFMGARSGRRQQRQAGEHGQQAVTQGLQQAHLLSLLTEFIRNLPIRSSSTSADWVSWMVLPSASRSSSPPTLMPMYFSPSRPAVRIEAVESSGRLFTRFSISMVTRPV